MTRRLRFNPEPCTGCLNCRAACIQRHAGQADPDASGLRIDLDPFTGIHAMNACRQCAEAACAKACPKQAIERIEPEGYWVIRRDRCVRCGTCVPACPFGAMAFSATAGPVKCDLCEGAPRCAVACHFGVIRFAEPGDRMPIGIPAADVEPAG